MLNNNRNSMEASTTHNTTKGSSFGVSIHLSRADTTEPPFSIFVVFVFE